MLNSAWCPRYAAFARACSGALAWVSTGCFQPDVEDRASLTDSVVIDGSGGGMNASGGSAGAGGASGAPGGGSLGPWPGDCKERWNPGEKYHAEGYGAAEIHGVDAKLGAPNMPACTNCHGDTLAGCGAATTCDSCHDGGHPDGWRENCTYCHGGVDNDSGAPPSDLDRTTPSGALTFTAHTRHMTGDNHLMYDCNQCHVKHDTALSPGHMFDDTPGKAELTFAMSLSPGTAFDGPGSGSCKNNYCHGSGLEVGEYSVKEGAPTCETCHGTADLKRLSWDHDRHINTIRKFEAITCASCHPNANKEGKLTDASTHVDGKIDVAGMGITWDPAAKTCSGTCHTSYPHTNAKWEYKSTSIF